MSETPDPIWAKIALVRASLVADQQAVSADLRGTRGARRAELQEKRRHFEGLLEQLDEFEKMVGVIDQFADALEATRAAAAAGGAP